MQSFDRLRVWTVLGAAALFAGAIGLAAAVPTAKPMPLKPTKPGHIVVVPHLQIRTGNVQGSIHVRFNDKLIYLTDFPVFLRNVSSGANGAPVTTDRMGHYHLRRQLNGDYHLCWSAPGWTPGCAANLIQVRGNISYLPSQRILPAVGSAAVAPTGAAMWGRVTLVDGSSPYFFDSYLGVTQDVKVVIRSGATTLATVYTNTSGEFVVPFVLFAGGPKQVTATAGGGTATVAAGQGGALTVMIKDHRPSIVGIATQRAGKQRKEVPAGAVLTAAAETHDADGDKLKVIWKTAPANGTLGNASGASTTWTVPDRPGVMVLYALANDGKGGITTNATAVSAGTDKAYFSLALSDGATRTRVTNAIVTVNGTPAVLEPKGLFFAKAASSDRYVVNVSAPGYIFVSRIYDHGDVFHEVTLDRPTLIDLPDATRAIDLVDTRKDLRKQGYIDAAPAEIHIRGGTLIRPDKTKASGRVKAEIGAINVSSEQFPGDNGGLRGTKDVGLISYGAMHVELRDTAGNRLQLAAGQSADVVIPVPFQMLQAPHTHLPIWYYDEQSGFWVPFTKPATYDPQRRAYVATVTHLSAYNIDYDADDLACFRVLLDNVQGGQLQARVSWVAGTLFPNSAFFDIHDQLNVIKRLPPNGTVHIDLQKDDGTAEPDLLLLDDQQVVHPDGNFTTGPATLPHFPDAPYTNCKTISVRTGLSAPAGVEAVQFLSLYSGVGTQAATQDYYLHHDPAMTHSVGGYSGGTHATLGQWWTLAGFTTPSMTGGPNSASDERREPYLNYNDLGFGRDMHIRQQGNTVFAFVTNFVGPATAPKPDQNPQNAIYARDQIADKVIATVAMEATDGLDDGGNTVHKVVKFWVYAGNQAGSPLIDSADLDGFGQKFVPQLCQVCHGGAPYPGGAGHTNLEYDLRTSAAVPGAVLREFDLASYLYPGDSAPGNVAGLSGADLSNFFDLNQLVIASGTQPAMAELIGGFNPDAATFDAGWAPSTWAADTTKKDFYVDVVGKSCRTCHIAFDATATIVGHSPNTLNWQDYGTFTTARPLIENAVCGGNKYMPHALMTFRNFWLGTLGGPYEPPRFAAFTTAEWGAPIGTCR